MTAAAQLQSHKHAQQLLAKRAGELLSSRSHSMVGLPSPLALKLHQGGKTMAETAVAHAAQVQDLQSLGVAGLGHEIRTPLSALLGLLDVGRSRLAAIEKMPAANEHCVSAPDPDELQALFNGAYESAQSLMDLVDTLLDVSKLESGHMALKLVPVDIEDLVNSTVRMFTALAQKKKLDLSTHVFNPGNFIVQADAIRLRQVLSNLLSNAIKFTEEGRVTVTVIVTESGDARAKLHLGVSDTGVGMAAEATQRLFEPYYRAHEGTPIGHAVAGSGLGLAISRQIVQLMGGHIRATSQPGVGTTMDVKLELPRHLSAPKAKAASVCPTALGSGVPFKGMQACVVDDHPANQLVAARQLESLGFQVTTFSSARSALARWSCGRFSLAVLDCYLPGMGGFELAAELRKLESAAGIGKPMVIIGCSAADIRLEAGADGAGMNLCLKKPLAPRKVQDAMMQYGGFTSKATGETVNACEADSNANSGAQLLAVKPNLSFCLKKLEDSMGPYSTSFLYTLYKENLRNMAQLDKAIERGDAKQIAALAHHIKGAANQIAATEVIGRCTDVQEVKGATPGLKIYARKLIEAVSTLNQDMRACLEGGAP